MRIAVDARSVYQEPSLRGVGRTLLELYRNLALLRPDWTFEMYYQVPNGRDPLADHLNVTRRPIDGMGDRFHAWQHFWFPLSARMAGADVLHCHGAIAPRFSLTRMVTTIHDLTPLEFQPDDPAVQAWAANVARGARCAYRVLVCSEHTRREVHRMFSVPLTRIVTVYWGPPKMSVNPQYPTTKILAQYDLEAGRPYVLHFGMAKPRKNTRRILEAWARLPEGVRSNRLLLVVGLESHALQGFQAQVRDLGLEGSCRLHSYVPEEDIPALLRGASVLCYLSLAEGFGLPVLDAFASDTAVLCSNTTSLPEVAGDAALMVDPMDVEAIKDGLHRLLTDETKRSELIARGRVQCSRFSWERCAEQVAEVFASA